MSDALPGEQVDIDFIPSNYTPTSNSVEDHLASIDAALGSLGPGAGTGTTKAVVWNPGLVGGDTEFEKSTFEACATAMLITAGFGTIYLHGAEPNGYVITSAVDIDLERRVSIISGGAEDESGGEFSRDIIIQEDSCRIVNPLTVRAKGGRIRFSRGDTSHVNPVVDFISSGVGGGSSFDFEGVAFTSTSVGKAPSVHFSSNAESLWVNLTNCRFESDECMRLTGADTVVRLKGGDTQIAAADLFSTGLSSGTFEIYVEGSFDWDESIVGTAWTAATPSFLKNAPLFPRTSDMLSALLNDGATEHVAVRHDLTLDTVLFNEVPLTALGGGSLFLADDGSYKTTVLPPSAASQQTGVLAAGSGLITPGAAVGSVDITAGSGHIYQISDGAATPTVTPVSWSAETDLAVTNIATTQLTHFLVNSSGTIIQISGGIPTDAQLQANIYLGYTFHPDNTTINADDIASVPILGYASDQDFRTFISMFDPFFKNIQVVANGTNLNIDLTPGDIFMHGVNFHTDPTNPSKSFFAGVSPATFDRIYHDGTLGGETVFEIEDTQSIDPTQWDDGGVLTSIGGNDRRSTIQRVYVGPTGILFVAYGQEFFSDIESATAAAGAETFVESGGMQISTLLGRIVMRRSTTDLSDPEYASFIPSHGGGSGGAPAPVGPDGCLLGHTGLLSGGLLSINANPALFDVSAGSCWVVDHSDPLNPVCVPVSWPNLVGLSVTDLATSSSVSIGIDSTGTIIQLSNAAASPQQTRDFVMFGALVINNFTDIDEAFNVPSAPAHNGIQSFWDFIRNVIGPANAGGNLFLPASTDLTMQKTAGSSFSLGANFHVNPQVPDLTTDAFIPLVTFAKVYRSATPGVVLRDGPDVTVLDPSQWDDGSGTLQTVPNNDYTVQVVYWTPVGITAEFVAYGQEVFTTEEAAIDALRTGELEYEERPQLAGLIPRAFIIIREDETDLNDATIIEAPAFRIKGLAGAIGGGGGAGIIAPLSRILYVDPVAAAGGNGSSATPFTTIQAALNATTTAAPASWVIVAVPGAYSEQLTFPTNRKITIINGALYGESGCVSDSFPEMTITSPGADHSINVATEEASLVFRGVGISDITVVSALNQCAIRGYDSDFGDINGTASTNVCLHGGSILEFSGLEDFKAFSAEVQMSNSTNSCSTFEGRNSTLSWGATANSLELSGTSLILFGCEVTATGTPTIEFTGAAGIVQVDSFTRSHINAGDISFVNVAEFHTKTLYRWIFGASDFEDAAGSDWAVDNPAGGTADSNNPALNVRRFPDTGEFGVGFTIDIPFGVTRILLKQTHRRETNGAASNIQTTVYARSFPDDAAVTAWSAALDLGEPTGYDMPANEFWQYDSEVHNLSDLGLVAGRTTQFELTRQALDGDDDLAGDWTLLQFAVEMA